MTTDEEGVLIAALEKALNLTRTGNATDFVLPKETASLPPIVKAVIIANTRYRNFKSHDQMSPDK